MRCVKEEHTAVNMNLHYLDNGTVMLNFIYQKELFFLPLGFALKVAQIDLQEDHAKSYHHAAETDTKYESMRCCFSNINIVGYLCLCCQGPSGLFRLPDLPGTD